MSEAASHVEERVVVLAPTPKDAERTCSVLVEAHVHCTPCRNLQELCHELEVGAGAAVLTEEAFAADRDDCLAQSLAKQPPWSDLPLVVLTAGGADSPVALRALETLGNVTLIERPVRLTTLVSAVRAALRARGRQYQVRDHLVERETVAVALKDADRRKDEFLAVLAHELRNPLAPIRNALQVLRMRPGGDAITAQMGAMMERQVNHMVRLVDDLLDVSRIARGKIELRKETLPLATVVTRAVESVRPAVDERRHTLDVSLPSEPLWLEADCVRLEQVLSNLLTNACKYTEPGGHICLAASRQEDEIVIRVRDNGIGIRPEMLAQIFEMFAQADRVAGRLSEGLGLGLSLVKSLVEMHGGSVAAFSEGPGHGSEFVVRLPIAPAAAHGSRSAQAGAVAPRRPLRVLIVDDNVDSANSLAVMLRITGGHEVRVAYDGAAGLEEARTFQPSVVLLDIGLPKGMNGHEVAQRLRRQPATANVFLIALTGYGQQEDRERSRAAGFDAHLVKPAAPEALQELLTQGVRSQTY